MNMQTLPALTVIEGDLLCDALISPEEMARMNDARATFRELRSILMGLVIPALGGFSNPIATEIELRLESIVFDSQNFLWPHRYAGATHSDASAGGAA